MVTKEELIEFEEEIATLFNSKKIKAPIHLYSGVENQMIEVFKNIDIKNDWVCATWRNHYQCLLKGVPKDLLKQKILDGKSMVMCIPEYKIYCSSIVGGIAPIATGIAMAEKLKGTTNRVWCWLGDMSASTGIFFESFLYANNHDLPITFIVEKNGVSVLTPVEHAWGINIWDDEKLNNKHVIKYSYKNEKYPHAGAGERVQF